MSIKLGKGIYRVVTVLLLIFLVFLPFSIILDIYTTYPNVDWLRVFFHTYFWVGICTVIGLDSGVNFLRRHITDRFGWVARDYISHSVTIVLCLTIMYSLVKILMQVATIGIK